MLFKVITIQIRNGVRTPRNINLNHGVFYIVDFIGHFPHMKLNKLTNSTKKVLNSIPSLSFAQKIRSNVKRYQYHREMSVLLEGVTPRTMLYRVT